MVDTLARPTDKVEVYFFTEQPNGYITEEDLAKYPATRMEFPNSHFDPDKAHVLYTHIARVTLSCQIRFRQMF